MGIVTLFHTQPICRQAENICRSLDQEVMHTAIAAIKVASAAWQATAAEGKQDADVVPTLIRLLPLECRMFPLVIQRLTPLILDGESIATLYIFYASVDLARTLVMIANDAPTECDDRMLQTIATAWRRVCQRAVTTLEQMSALQEDFGTSTHAEARMELAKALRSTANGAWVDAGEIRHPDLRENRRTARLSTRHFGWIPVRGVEQPVIIRDVTDGGCGFDIQVGLREGQALELNLADGRRLPGRVTWAHATSAGMKFDNTLAANDPLLQTQSRRF